MQLFNLVVDYAELTQLELAIIETRRWVEPVGQSVLVKIDEIKRNPGKFTVEGSMEAV